MDRKEFFHTVFNGLLDAYGILHTDSEKNEVGKLEGQVFFVRENVTPLLWQKHLNGEAPSLGIVPINREHKCSWGCIDVDEYPYNHLNLIKKIKKLNLPLIVFKSKSGGAHVFLFSQKKITAQKMQDTLKVIAASLGLAGKEIYPKQTSLIEKRDVGNCLNMPYFGGDNSSRHALTDKGEPATISQFAEMYQEKVIVDFSKLNLPSPSSELIPKGPPCLQKLCEQGLKEGERNEGLYNLGVYLRKAHPDEWEYELDKHNHKYCTPPLKPPEMKQLVKSLNKKDYFYKCSQPPIVNYCNKKLCLTREYGIGGTPSAIKPTYCNLQKYASTPPIWYLDIQVPGKKSRRLKLSTQELDGDAGLRRACMEQVHYCPPMLKKTEWIKTLNTLYDKKSFHIIPSTGESNPLHQLHLYLNQFCRGEAMGTDLTDLSRHIPIALEDSKEIIFDFQDFWTHLSRNKWDQTQQWTERELTTLGAKSETKYLGKDRRKRVRIISKEKLDAPPPEPKTDPEEIDET